MNMRKFQNFFYDLLQTSKDLNIIRNLVKSAIGDSKKNNRTLTVSQVIRYLEQNHVRGSRSKARKIRAVYDLLRADINRNRSDFSNRTDAIDINELVNTYRNLVMNNKDRSTRIAVGKLVG
jgi:hypothetical protein